MGIAQKMITISPSSWVLFLASWLVMNSISLAAAADPTLLCTEQGMTFSYPDPSGNAFVNLLKLTEYNTDPVLRFRNDNDTTISLCGTADKSAGTYTMLYSTCAGKAISLVQTGDNIIRRAVMEVQPNANAANEVLRWLNYTQYEIGCTYQRQYNKSAHAYSRVQLSPLSSPQFSVSMNGDNVYECSNETYEFVLVDALNGNPTMVSLMAYNQPNHYLYTNASGLALLVEVTATSPSELKEGATFKLEEDLFVEGSVSIRSAAIPEYFLCVQDGCTSGVKFEALNTSSTDPNVTSPAVFTLTNGPIYNPGMLVGVQTIITKKELTEQVTFQLTMDLYDSPSFANKAVAPNQVALNEPMYVAIDKTWNDTNLKMVVQDCWATDTAAFDSSNQYGFLNKGCGVDHTYATLLETTNTFRFKINSFVFIQLKSQVYLHCSLYVCEAGSSTDKCQQGCNSNRRKRRAVGESGPEETGRAISSQIKFVHKATCNSLTCPKNSECVENYPAFCRCEGDRVMDERTNQCTDTNLVEMKLPTQLFWVKEYGNKKSSEFTRLAAQFKKRLVDYLIKERRVQGVTGLEIKSAVKTGDFETFPDFGGFVTFRLVMSLESGTTISSVSSQLQSLLTEELTTRTDVQTAMQVEIVEVKIQASLATQKGADDFELTKLHKMIIVGISVFVIAVACFVVFTKRSQRKGANTIHIDQEFGATKVAGTKVVTTKENLAYIH